MIPNPMRDPYMRAGLAEFHFQFLLKVGARWGIFGPGREPRSVAALRDCHRRVVRIIRSLHLRRNPKTVASIKPEVGAAGLARILRYFMEQVFPIAKPVGDDPRPDIRSYHQFDDVI